MEIKDLVNKDCHRIESFVPVHILRDYLLHDEGVAMFDEDKAFMGILSKRDVVSRNKFLAIDCISQKPRVQFNDMINDVINLMLNQKLEVLPVFDLDDFYGIITLTQLVSSDEKIITKGLVENDLKSPQKKDVVKVSDEESIVLERQTQLMHSLIHDLRSPITRVAGLIELCEIEKELQKKLEFLPLIKDNISKLRKLVEYISDFFRLGTNESSLKLEIHDLYDIILQQLPNYKFDADKKKIQIILEPKQGNNIAFTDSLAFTRIIDNLISNAIKFSYKDGLIRIKIEQVKNMIEVTVKDYGIGIPQESILDIFTPLKGLNRAGTFGEKSIGLGLSITKHFVDNLKGNIEVESKENKGSTFKVYLPKDQFSINPN